VLYTGEKVINVAGSELAQGITEFKKHGNKQVLVDSVIYNSSAHIEVDTDKETGKTSHEVKGNVTEAGIINFFVEAEENVYQKMAGRSAETLWTIPFNSLRKRQTTAVKLGENHVRVYVKGAPEFVLE